MRSFPRERQNCQKPSTKDYGVAFFCGFVVDFTCQRCGRCCKEIGIPWTELDPRLVSDYLNMDFRDFLDSYGFIVNEYSGEIEPTEFGVTPCPFLKWNMEKAVCKIYPVRPWICKDYPGPGTRCRKEQKGA